MNPFQHLYERCNRGTGDSKLADLSDGPIMVDIEPVGLCNFRCTMCPTGLGALGRPSGFMTEDTHTRILDITEPCQSAIRYIGFGEPLMHPEIVDFVWEAYLSGRLTHINTNGSKLTPKMAGELVNAGLSSIKFSFQGVDRESYLAMRRTDFFDGMLEAIKMMRAARRKAERPFIAASTTTTTETPQQVEAFRQVMLPLVDQLSIGRTVFDFIADVPPKRREEFESAKPADVEKRHPDPCPEAYDKLTIHWDGTARVCCNDYDGKTNLGNVNTSPMKKIWLHPTMKSYREKLAAGDYSSPNCNVCYDYMGLTG